VIRVAASPGHVILGCSPHSTLKRRSFDTIQLRDPPQHRGHARGVVMSYAA
jgi:hypothetical protein